MKKARINILQRITTRFVLALSFSLAGPLSASSDDALRTSLVEKAQEIGWAKKSRNMCLSGVFQAVNAIVPFELMDLRTESEEINVAFKSADNFLLYARKQQDQLCSLFQLSIVSTPFSEPGDILVYSKENAACRVNKRFGHIEILTRRSRHSDLFCFDQCRYRRKPNSCTPDLILRINPECHKKEQYASMFKLDRDDFDRFPLTLFPDLLLSLPIRI